MANHQKPNFVLQRDTPSDLSIWSGFFRKPIEQRQEQIDRIFKECGALDVLSGNSLPLASADLMVENCIGTCSLPLGIVPILVLNHIHYIVPMCTEEPSVIAAASSSSKLIAKHGGFQGLSSANIMTGQIQVLDIPKEEVETAMALIQENQLDLIETANSFCQSMVKRGGGVCGIQCSVIAPYGDEGDRWIIVYFDIDVCDAMGANIVNSVAEGLSPSIRSLIGGRIGLQILTNLCIKRTTKVSFSVPIEELGWKGIEGIQVAKRIVEAWTLADLDPFRATTHNKGIMNGIDAVAIATGQDWRAIEASAHAFAASSGRYRSLSKYRIEENHFIGELEIPISVGTKGGALATHPMYRFTHSMLDCSSAQELAQVIVAVGLAQNFSALRALSVEGIQKGHMQLHARNIAVAAGAPPHLVGNVVEFMQKRSEINVQTAMKYLQSLQEE